MKRRSALLAIIGLMTLSLVAPGCTDAESAQSPATGDQGGTGTLVFVANGEEFAREGLRSVDGWDITFDHAYVTLADMRAVHTDPPYEAEDGGEITGEAEVTLAGPVTVDLAAADADPAEVGRVDAAEGHYNALEWSMVGAESGPAEGYSVVFVGQATKDGEVVDFTLRFDADLRYRGGDYVGDDRKGIVRDGESAEIEMTFHFDHFFGSDEEDADAEMNEGALGFGPLAALATDSSLDADLADLQAGLSAEEYNKIEEFLVHFGHVGEGHANAERLN